MKWLVVALSVLASCLSPKVYDKPALTNQILQFREGYPGLSHGRCAAYTKDKCTTFEVVDYDLSKQDVRDSLRVLNFICKVGDTRFKICKDQAGLCSRTYEVKHFLFFTFQGKPIDTFISQDDKARLLNADTICFNEDAFNFLDF